MENIVLRILMSIGKQERRMWVIISKDSSVEPLEITIEAAGKTNTECRTAFQHEMQIGTITENKDKEYILFEQQAVITPLWRITDDSPRDGNSDLSWLQRKIADYEKVLTEVHTQLSCRDDNISGSGKIHKVLDYIKQFKP